METLYHNFCNNASKSEWSVEISTSYIGTVMRETPSGCIVEITLDNGLSAMSYVFGQWNIGDKLLVCITKIFEDRFPRGVCETVLSYAEDAA